MFMSQIYSTSWENTVLFILGGDGNLMVNRGNDDALIDHGFALSPFLPCAWHISPKMLYAVST